jgi:Brp/Blh family beta-carotene 15,15'-monooxygenase
MIWRSLLTIALALFALCLPAQMEALQLPFFLAVVGTLGMAHGSMDHMVHLPNNSGILATLRFYGWYILAAAAVGALWWISPTAGILLFLGNSAYHFGQSEVRWRSKRKWSLPAARMTWGLALLALPAWRHAASMESALMGWDMPVEASVFAFWAKTIWWASLFVLGLGTLDVSRKKSMRLLAKPWMSLLAYSFLFWTLPTLWAFSIYFGLWHSWPALSELAAKLRLKSVRDWIVALAPNYLPALVATIAWIWLANRYMPSYTVAGLLVLLSALTLPHTWVFERFYAGKSRSKQQPEPVADRFAAVAQSRAGSTVQRLSPKPTR